MPDPFSYQGKLSPEHVRLLHIRPGSGSTPIACNLSEHQLSEVRGSFIALSYACREHALNQAIVCNDKSLAITNSLYEALWQYRESQDSWLLWVDVMCINQKDIDEKSVQVRMMKRIYSEALQVLVWLGHPETGEKEILHVKDLIQKICTTEIPDSVEHPILDCQYLGLLPLEDSVWPGLLSLLKRPWFRRAWIIQEMAVNQKIIFKIGAIQLDADALLNASWVCTFTNVRQLSRHVSNSIKPVYDGRLVTAPFLMAFRNWVQDGVSYPLHIWLEYARSFETTDPRDRVFALAGLAGKLDQGFVDYRKSLDQIIVEAAGHAITYAGCHADSEWVVPDVLSHLFWAHISQSLPSWAVNFTVNSGHMPLHRCNIFTRPTFSVSSTWEFVPNKYGTPIGTHTRLRTLAKRIDAVNCTVEETSSMLHGVGTHLENIPLVQGYFTLRTMANTTAKWFREVCRVAGKHGTAYDRLAVEDVVWRTLVCDNIYPKIRAVDEDKIHCLVWQKWVKACVKYHNNPMLHAKDLVVPEFAVLATIFLLFLFNTDTWPYPFPNIWTRLAGTIIAVAISTWSFGQILEWVPQVWDVDTIEAYANEAAAFNGALGRFNSTRKFFVSQSGRVGLLPLLARADDLIVVFPESHILFVLRPVEDGYHLLGDCYIHGMMDGEGHNDAKAFETIDII